MSQLLDQTHSLDTELCILKGLRQQLPLSEFCGCSRRECSLLCRTKEPVPATPPSTPQDNMSSNYWRPVGQSQGNQQTQQDRNPLKPSINSATKEVSSLSLHALQATCAIAAAAAESAHIVIISVERQQARGQLKWGF